MCLNLNEAKKIYEYLQNGNIFFLEGFAYRSHKQTAVICNFINSGEIGRILEVESSFGFKSGKINPNSRLYNKNFGGGAILDVGCYTTSFSLLIARVTLGENFRNYKIENIQGSLAETGVDIHAEADIIFNDELKIKVKTSLKENLNNQCVLYGTKGKIIIPSPWLPNLKTYIEIYHNNNYYKKFINSKFSIYAQQIIKFNDIILSKNLETFDPVMKHEESLINFKIINDWKNGLDNSAY
jgi:predicted dehydrogenase